MQKRLIENMTTLSIPKEVQVISNEIFRKMESFKLLDKYKSYQAFKDQWKKIAIDLEIIQTEGFDAVKKVDPNMVIKKKDNREEEVQEGWMGRVIPFEIVQNTVLKAELTQLQSKEARLSEILSSYQEIIDSLSEEEKELVLNDNGDAFDAKKVKEQIKELDDDINDEESLKYKLDKYTKLATEEKELKKTIKSDSEDLHIKTKETIESLSNEEAIDLLIHTWINPLMESINKLPNEIVNELTLKVKLLKEKYNTTFSEITKEIANTQETLLSLLDELEGDDFDMKGLSELKSLIKGD
jgi:type I restriction enzyme M protein